MVFETERLIVRHYTMEDAALVYRLNKDPEVMQYIRPVMDEAEAYQFLLNNIELYRLYPKLGRWAAFDRSGNFIGSFAVIHIPGSTDIQLGYALLKEYWGKGYASELTKRGVQYCIEHQIDPLYAVTESENTASQHVLLKNGFEFLFSREENNKTLYRYLLVKK